MKKILIIIALLANISLSAQKISSNLAKGYLEYYFSIYDTFIEDQELKTKSKIFFNKKRFIGFKRLKNATENKLIYFYKKNRSDVFYVEEYSLENNKFIVLEYYGNIMNTNNEFHFWPEDPKALAQFEIKDYQTLLLYNKDISNILKWFKEGLTRQINDSLTKKEIIVQY